MYNPKVYELLNSEIQSEPSCLSEFCDVIEVIRETLLFRSCLDQLRNAIDRCRALVQTEQNLQMAHLLWRKSVICQIEHVICMSWSSIADELSIIEHAGLSVYALKWPEWIAKRSKDIDNLLSSSKDYVDVEQVLESILQLDDTLIAIDLTAETKLRDFADAYARKLRTAIQQF